MDQLLGAVVYTTVAACRTIGIRFFGTRGLDLDRIIFSTSHLSTSKYSNTVVEEASDLLNFSTTVTLVRITVAIDGG